MDMKNACFQDLSGQVDSLVRKLYELYVTVKVQGSALKTFEETMIQLDTVFTDKNDEVGNIEVACELRKMQENQLVKIFDLQSELNHLKALKDMPIDLAQILQKAMPKDPTSVNTQNVTMSAIENESKPVSKNNRTRSKPKKPNQRTKSHGSAPNKHKIVNRNASMSGEFFDINNTLDKIAELEA